MEEQKSRFGLNLFLQFVILFIFAMLTDYSGVFQALMAVSMIIFFFGIVYGVFRLLGAKGGTLEGFYQNFPVGMFGKKHIEVAENPILKPVSNPNPQPSFKWQKLFTFQYLRYAGFLLIFSAISSLLFQIEWALYQKIIFTLSSGVVFLVLAEVFWRKSKLEFASTSSLVSFGMLQFGLTLLHAFFSDSSSVLIANPYFWLGLKTAFSIVFMFSLFRYPSKIQPFVYFSIAYVNPFSIVSNSNIPPLNLEYLMPTVAILSLLIFWIAFMKRNYVLLLLNVIAFNLVVLMFPALYSLSPLVILGTCFLLHIGFLLSALFREGDNALAEQVSHNIVLHLFTLLNVLWVLDTTDVPEILNDYPGILLLGFAGVTFIAYMITQGKKINNALTEMLLNTSVIVSAVGLLLQVEGKWTAIVFLMYSCFILWYGIHKKWLRTIIYGFIFLTISIFRLYFASPEIFDSIVGTMLILVIGMFLLVLSYKFEKIKDYIENFKEKEKT